MNFNPGEDNGWGVGVMMGGDGGDNTGTGGDGMVMPMKPDDIGDDGSSVLCSGLRFVTKRGAHHVFVVEFHILSQRPTSASRAHPNPPTL